MRLCAVTADFSALKALSWSSSYLAPLEPILASPAHYLAPASSKCYRQTLTEHQLAGT